MSGDVRRQRAIREAADHHRESVVQFQRTWASWKHSTPNGDKPVPLGDDWRNSLSAFLAHGLPLDELIDLIPVAMRKRDVLTEDRWRYYCGCAWNRIREFDDADAN